MSIDPNAPWLHELCECGHKRKSHVGVNGEGRCGALVAPHGCAAFAGTGEIDQPKTTANEGTN